MGIEKRKASEVDVCVILLNVVPGQTGDITKPKPAAVLRVAMISSEQYSRLHSVVKRVKFRLRWTARVDHAIDRLAFRTLG